MTTSEPDPDEGKRAHHEHVSELRARWANGERPNLGLDPWLTGADIEYIVTGEVPTS